MIAQSGVFGFPVGKRGCDIQYLLNQWFFTFLHCTLYSVETPKGLESW
jgi:hypothetical protein